MMQYSAIAQAYDDLMYDVPYEEWAAYIISLLKHNRIAEGLLLEYACGTGNITVPLLRAGFEVIAIDISAEMLDEARAKVRANALEAQFVCADMAGVQVNRKAEAAICACDGVNYLLTKDAVQSFFSGVFYNIKPGGVFLFDISSAYKIETELGNEFFYDDGDEQTLFWQNEYDDGKKQVTMDLTLFIRDGQGYHRVDETHVQRAWEKEEIAGMLKMAGFHEIEVFGFLTGDRPDADARRLQFVARKEEKA